MPLPPYAELKQLIAKNEPAVKTLYEAIRTQSEQGSNGSTTPPATTAPSKPATPATDAAPAPAAPVVTQPTSPQAGSGGNTTVFFLTGEVAANLGSLANAGQVDYGWKEGTNFFKISEALVAKHSAKGVRKWRVNIDMERMTPTKETVLDMNYYNLLKEGLLIIRKYKGKVLLDNHNYGRYKNNVITDEMLLARWWVTVINQIIKDGLMDTIYGWDLMNEPHDLVGTYEQQEKLWARQAQNCINEIRKIDKNSVIAINPFPWATTQNVEEFYDVLDALTDPGPVFNLELSTHLYYDPNAGGGYTSDAVNDNIGVERLAGVVNYIKKNPKWKASIGETNAPNDRPVALRALDKVMAVAMSAGITVYVWWIGPNAGDNILSVEHSKGSKAWDIMCSYIPRTKAGAAALGLSAPPASSTSPAASIPETVAPAGDGKSASVKAVSGGDWENGVWIKDADKAGLCLDAAEAKAMNWKVGDTAKLVDGTTRKVTWAAEGTNGNYSLFMEGARLDPSKVGYPHAVTKA